MGRVLLKTALALLGLTPKSSPILANESFNLILVMVKQMSSTLIPVS